MLGRLVKNTVATLMLFSFVLAHVYGQNRGPRPDPKVKELMDLKGSTLLDKKLDSLWKSDQEADLSLLSRYYSALQNTEKLNEVTQLSLEKFPDGQAAFNQAADDLYNEADTEEKVKKYHQFMARFKGKPEFEGNAFLQSANTFVAFSFAKTDPTQVRVWMDKITDPLYRTKAYSYGARELHAAGNNKEADELIVLALHEASAKSPVDSVDYFEYVRMYASILLAREKYEEAYQYGKLVHDEVSKPVSKIHKAWTEPINQVYHNALVGTRRYKEVFPLMEESLRNGTATPLIKERFKEAYAAVKGNDNNYDSYYDGLVSVLADKIKKETEAEMINVPAYNFSLKDVQGNTVSLADLKGKVVVLDFWATWCGPCKASFPRMQTAVNTFKDDPEVTFLFIHTWESTNDPKVATENAVSYLKENNYTFDLLMDLKDNSGAARSNAAALGFGLKGIPTKLILDKNGNIRFNIVGDSKGGDDAFMAHMEAMIELAKKNS